MVWNYETDNELNMVIQIKGVPDVKRESRISLFGRP